MGGGDNVLSEHQRIAALAKCDALLLCFSVVKRKSFGTT
jgi:hypothetical protein